MSVLQVGVIGLGRIGKIHLANLRFLPNAHVTALSDVCEPNSNLIGSAKFYKEPKDLISDPLVQAVVICSPTAFHCQQLLECVEAGKPVFCEKPLDLDFETGENVREKVQDSGHFVMIGFNRRFDSGFSRIQTAIQQGEIGNLHTLHITSRDGRKPPIEYVKTSGGLHLDQSIHDFDMCRFLSGLEVTQVYAKGACLVDEKIGQTGDIDTSIVTLTLANGALATVTNSREAKFGIDQRVEALGSGAMIRLENKNDYTCLMSTTKGTTTEQPPGAHELSRYDQAYATEIQTFVECVINGRPSPTTVSDAQKAAAIAKAAKQSLKCNAAVDL